MPARLRRRRLTAYHSRSVNQPAGSFAMCRSLFVCLFGVRDALCVFVYVMCLACQGGKVYCIILIISRSFAPPLPLFLTAFNHIEPSRAEVVDFIHLSSKSLLVKNQNSQKIQFNGFLRNSFQKISDMMQKVKGIFQNKCSTHFSFCKKRNLHPYRHTRCPF